MGADIFLVRVMKRAILLQTVATNSKNNRLKEFIGKAVAEYNRLLAEREGCSSFMQFHRKTLSASKEATSFNVQVRCSLIRDAWRKRTGRVNGLVVKFNVPRNCKTFSTKEYFFVEFGLYPRKRVAIPIRKNRNYQRYSSLIQNGWQCKTYGLTSDGQVVAFLSKEAEIESRKNVLGVDVNSKCFAVSILTPEGKVLKQLYLGKDIWVKRKKIMIRREKLQSHADKGSHIAKQKLELLEHKERNFVKNRIGEVVRDITNLASKYKADIAIEKLKRFSPKGRKFNKEVLRMPFYLFKKTLENRCFDKNIKLYVIDAYHTSKWCSHCGAVAKSGHSNNYALFRCKCGQIVNSDRKASLAVAVKSLLERKLHSSNQVDFFQLSSRRVPVNGLFRSNDGFGFGAVHFESTPMERHPL